MTMEGRNFLPVHNPHPGRAETDSRLRRSPRVVQKLADNTGRTRVLFIVATFTGSGSSQGIQPYRVTVPYKTHLFTESTGEMDLGRFDNYDHLFTEPTCYRGPSVLARPQLGLLSASGPTQSQSRRRSSPGSYGGTCPSRQGKRQEHQHAWR